MFAGDASAFVRSVAAATGGGVRLPELNIPLSSALRFAVVPADTCRSSVSGGDGRGERMLRS